MPNNLQCELNIIQSEFDKNKVIVLNYVNK